MSNEQRYRKALERIATGEPQVSWQAISERAERIARAALADATEGEQKYVHTYDYTELETHREQGRNAERARIRALVVKLRGHDDRAEQVLQGQFDYLLRAIDGETGEEAIMRSLMFTKADMDEQRNTALEEAAKVAEEVVDYVGAGDSSRAWAETIARNIRALKDTE